MSIPYAVLFEAFLRLIDVLTWMRVGALHLQSTQSVSF